MPLNYRVSQSSPLTIAQMDGNFYYLSESISTVVPTTAQTASYITGSNVDGTVATAITATTAATASYAITAETALYVDSTNVEGPYGMGSVETSSYAVTASYALTGDTNTGDITFEGVKIIGAGTGSGDGNNYSTIELVPDNDLYNNDQYLILDPTGPNHIHIRAGGTIDDSAADLIIGGENIHLLVSDANNEIEMKRQSTLFVTDYTLISGSGYSSAEWSSSGSVYSITLNDPTQDAYDAVSSIIPNPPSFFSVIDSNSNYFPLEVLSTNTPVSPNPIVLTVNQAPPTNPISLDQVYFEINDYADSYVRVNSDVTIEAVDDLRMYSRDVFSLRNYSPTDPISIRTDHNNNDYSWEFNADGNTLFPYLTTPRGDTSSGNLTTSTLKLGDGTNEAVISTPDGNASYPSSQRLVINPGQGSGSYEGGDIYLWAGRGGVDGGSGGDIKIRGGYGPLTGGGGYVRIEGGDTTDGTAGFVEIKGGNSDTAAGGTVNIYGGFGNGNTQNGDVTIATYDTTGTQKTWTFDTEGTLTIADIFQLPVRTTNPGSPVEGMLMASGSVSLSKLYYYDGSIWNALF